MGYEFSEAKRLALAAERGIEVDPEDAWLLATYTWYVTDLVYAKTRLPGNGALMFLHHCIMGQPIDGSDIDHVDRNRLNNTRVNLRYLTRSGNMLNSGRSDAAYYVYSGPRAGTYVVEIQRDKQRHYLGVFETEEEAIAARDGWLDARP